MKTTRIKISGTVQGVSFRNFVKEQADELEIKGHVRNLDTGELEVVAEGKDENVNELIKRCKKGAPHSEVKGIEMQELNNIGFDDFKILKV